MQAPVEQRQFHGLIGCGVRGSGDLPGDRWGHVVRKWFGYSVEHEPDAHAGAEEHREPREHPELGLLVVTSQSDVADAADSAVQREDHETGGREDVPPADAVADHIVECFESIRGGSRVDHGKGDQGKDHYRRGDEHGFP